MTLPSKVQTVGYLRVSSADQNTVRQLEGLALDRKFTDLASGKDTNRPALAELVAYVREGDTVLVHSMDRLARNLDDLRRLVDDFTRRGVTVRFIRENLAFNGDADPMSYLLLNLLGAVAQFERELILERQREGIAIAKARGAYKGRRPSLTDDEITDLRRRIAAGEPKTTIAKAFKIHRQSVYRYASAAAILGGGLKSETVN